MVSSLPNHSAQPHWQFASAYFVLVQLKIVAKHTHTTCVYNASATIQDLWDKQTIDATLLSQPPRTLDKRTHTHGRTQNMESHAYREPHRIRCTVTHMQSRRRSQTCLHLLASPLVCEELMEGEWGWCVNEDDCVYSLGCMLVLEGGVECDDI